VIDVLLEAKLKRHAQRVVENYRLQHGEGGYNVDVSGTVWFGGVNYDYCCQLREYEQIGVAYWKYGFSADVDEEFEYLAPVSE
jgi:hypothetical protein